MRVCGFLFLVAALAGLSAAQDSASKVNNDFVQKEFGSTCALVDGQSPVVADVNGDGVADLVIPARCTNPMIDQTQYDFTVLDPYYSFFGYGDPKITSSFISDDPATKGMVVLVIHGSGPEAWYSPKEKFVLINLSFKKILLRKMKVRKKELMAIYTQETGGDQGVGAIFWDGKKYKYQPMGSTLE